jgi:hypothetical protein
LSRELFEKFQSAAEWQPSTGFADDMYATLRIVSLRFDHCPGLVPSPADCLPQIRMVVQPILGEGGRVAVEDATLHLLFDIPLKEFPDLVRDIRALKSFGPDLTSGEPLGVHPRLASSAPGVARTFSAGLMDLVKKYAGESRLSRIASMFSKSTFLLTKDNWVFAATNIEGGEATVVKLPHLEPHPFFPNTSETLVLRSSFGVFDPTNPNFDPNSPDPNNIGEATRNGAIVPRPVADRDNALFFIDSRNWADKSRRAEVERRLVTLLRIENPTLNSPLTMDCASCHVTTQIKTALQAHGYGDLLEKVKDQAYEAPSGVTLSERQRQGDEAGGKEAYVTVNFGYFGSGPAISQRTVNESAHVAAAFNAMP